MKPSAGVLVATAVFFAIGVSSAGQSLPSQDASHRVKLPEWMFDFLPRTSEERAKAAIFDSEGSGTLQLGVGMTRFVCGVAILGLTNEPPPYSLFLEQTVCPADAVVVGTPTPVAVRLNSRGTWLYTEHSFKVRRWVHPVGETATDIELLTSGGVLHTEGKTTMVSNSGPSVAGGKEYLVFLNRVPGTRAFRLGGHPISDGENWTASLRTALLPYELQNGDVPFDRFIDDLAIAAYSCRKQ